MQYCCLLADLRLKGAALLPFVCKHPPHFGASEQKMEAVDRDNLLLTL